MQIAIKSKKENSIMDAYIREQLKLKENESLQNYIKENLKTDKVISLLVENAKIK